MKCDLCGEDVLPGQPRRGGTAPPGFERHWDCHVREHGAPTPHVSIRELFAEVRGALGASPAQREPSSLERPARKQPKVRSGEYNRSENAGRSFTLYGFISEMGRRRGRCDCPFCGETFWVYVWSLSGGGKKCPNCRAMFGSSGTAYPLVGNEDL